MFDYDAELERNNAVTPEKVLDIVSKIDFKNVQISYVGEKIDFDLLEVYADDEQ